MRSDGGAHDLVGHRVDRQGTVVPSVRDRFRRRLERLACPSQIARFLQKRVAAPRIAAHVGDRLTRPAPGEKGHERNEWIEIGLTQGLRPDPQAFYRQMRRAAGREEVWEYV